MLSDQVIKKIEELASQVALREGCRLYDLEFVGASGQRVLRVFIDKETSPVGIEDCSNVSKGLNLLLDVEDLIPGGNYNLEISSPGLEKPLKKAWHFQSAVGQKVWIKLKQPLAQFGVQEAHLRNAKQMSEKLLAANDQEASFQLGEQEIKIPLQEIAKAHVVFEFDKDKNPKNKKGKH